MLFVRNIVVSGDYLRRGRVKKKVLFYVLFISQMLAPIGLIPVIMSYFTTYMDCTVVIMLSCVSAAVSLALLIIGILGVKAYKCLNNSRIVLIMLVLFQCGSTAAVILDLYTMRGGRRLSGSCIRVSDLRFTRVYVMVQLAESLFICGCFMYACWRSRGSSSSRGRISVRLSMDDVVDGRSFEAIEPLPARRGWWDYVPNAEQPAQPKSEMRVTKPQGVRQKFLSIFKSNPPNWAEMPMPPQPSRPPNGQAAESFFGRGHENNGGGVPPGFSSPAPSVLSLGRLFTRMELFREVMRDELFYMTFITASCVVVAVLAAIGVNLQNDLTVTGWIASNWAIISLLAIHSFGRVVRRHERDALLQHPSTWDALVRAGHATPNAPQRGRLQSTNRLQTGALSRIRIKRGNSEGADSPFSDLRRLNPARMSWESNASRRSTSRSKQPSPEITIQSFLSGPSQNIIRESLPSPLFESGFPTSGRVTPIVPHDSADPTTLIQGFSQSWILDHLSSHSSEYHGDE
ncbi:hypothetical protein BD779DRAFT_1666412 [Infundibulicybe gibba]|nr:hypothetical protein BD779DRAFT_1666412 [Infundibulicybe gibba]